MSNAGANMNELNELIMFRQPTRTPNAKGQFIETFSDYLKSMAKVERAGGEELAEGEKINLPEVYVFTTHYEAAVKSTWRIMYENVEYNLLANPEPLNHRIFMKMKAVKVFK